MSGGDVTHKGTTANREVSHGKGILRSRYVRIRTNNGAK